MQIHLVPDARAPRKSTVRDSEANTQKSHREERVDDRAVIRDIIIGFSDGLTVPFALTAGLSSLGSSRIVITAGLAELFSGAISMGLGAYLAGVTEKDHYDAKEKRQAEEIASNRREEEEEVFAIMGEYGVGRKVTRPVVYALQRNEAMWFMMDFGWKLEKPKASRAWISGLTMGMAYFVGGLIPMIPYFAIKAVNSALFVSISITVVVLLVFGYVKARITVPTQRAAVISAVQTLMIGALAAGASYGVVRALDRSHS